MPLAYYTSFSSGVLFPGRLSLGSLKAGLAKEKGLYTWWGVVVGSRGLTVGNAQARASGESIGVSSPRGSGVEHFLGKEGVTGSNPVVGSKPTA
jgi:hypothetical protein